MPHVELPQAEFKVVMLGDTDAGKTSLVLRFAEGYYRDRRSSTVGAFFITKRIQTSDGITCKIQIWDTAGQAQFRPMAPMYYRNAAAAIVCYDVTSSQSYAVMTEWLDELHKTVPAGSIVIAIAATKCDKVEQQPPNNREEDDASLVSSRGQQHPRDEVPQSPAVPFREAEALAQTLGAIYVRTSAKDNQGVNELFQRVAQRVLRFRRNKSEVGIPVTPGAVAAQISNVVTGGGGSTLTSGKVKSLRESLRLNGGKSNNGGDNNNVGVSLKSAGGRGRMMDPMGGGVGGEESQGIDGVMANSGGDLDTYHFDSIPGRGDTDPANLTVERKPRKGGELAGGEYHPNDGDDAAAPIPGVDDIGGRGNKKASKNLTMCNVTTPFMCDVFSTSTHDSTTAGGNDLSAGVVNCSVS